MGRPQSIDVSTDIHSTDNGNTSEQVTGTGKLVFDRKRGLLTSLNEKLDATITIDGKQTTATITLDLQLLTPDQVEKFKADAADRKAKLAEMMAKNPPGSRARAGRGDAAGDGQSVPTAVKKEEWADAIKLPEGTARTDFVGDSDGGGPFVKAGEGDRPMIGLKLKMGAWNGHKMIGEVDPIYDKPADATEGSHGDDKETVILAKDGYVIGGLWLNGPDMTDAVRVIFMKKTADGVDIKDAYVSPWFGKPIGDDRVKVGCDGKTAVGVFGRQGMNTNAMGLVMQSGGKAAAANAPDPTDDPNYQGSKGAKPATPAVPGK